jgi:hypothetical protein
MATQPDLSAASAFIWRTARLIDPYRFAYLFLDGEREAVLAALRPYQNLGGPHPLHFAPRPDSLARRLFTDQVIEAHLKALAEAQGADGGWFFNWREWNPTTTLEWRGWVTIDALKTLRAYGWLL